MFLEEQIKIQTLGNMQLHCESYSVYSAAINMFRDLASVIARVKNWLKTHACTH